MNEQELLKTRVERVKSAIKRKESDHVPLVIAYNTFPAFYYGYNLEDVYHKEPSLHGEIGAKFGAEFPCDGLFSFGNNNHVIAKPLGGGHVNLSPLGLQVSNQNCKHMEPDEYDELISDPIKYYEKSFFLTNSKYLKPHKATKK